MNYTHSKDIILEELTRIVNDNGVTQVITADNSVPPAPKTCSLPWSRLNFVQSGSLVVNYSKNGQEMTTTGKNGSCFYYQPWIWNIHPEQNIHQIYGLVFREDCIRYLWSENIRLSPNAQKDNCFWYHSSSPPSSAIRQLIGCINETIVESQDQQTTLTLLMNALFNLCLEQLVNDRESGMTRASYTFHNVCSYLHDHFQEPINRESVADHMHLTPNYLSRLFHQQSGQNFNHYLNDLRLQQASNLLRDFHLSVQEVAYRSGFNEIRHFIRTFKAKFGQSPGRWRTEQSRTF